MQFFRDCESGGAWPFLVRGVNCLLNCDNGRDLCLVTECRGIRVVGCQTKGTPAKRTGKRGKHGALCIACPTKMCVCGASSLIFSALLVALWDLLLKKTPALLLHRDYCS